MKIDLIHILLSMIDGIVKLIMVMLSALLIISVYKTTASMQLDDLLSAFMVLSENNTVIRFAVFFLVALLCSSICEVQKRKLTKK